MMKTPLLGRHYNEENSNNNSDTNNESVDKQKNIEVNRNDTMVNEIEVETNLNDQSHGTPTIAVSSNSSYVHNQGSNAHTRRFSLAGSNVLLSPQSFVIASIANNNSSAIFNGTSSAVLCRICYTSDSQREPLIHPCNCSGTMGLIHRSCLEKWLSQSNSNKCEICSYEFAINRTPRSFNQWLFRPVSTKDNKNLLNDFVCFLILTPLACISTWYCVVFAFKFHESENQWEASGLVVLTSFLLMIYILWLIFSCKYHYKIFQDWQKKNQIVTLKLSEERVQTGNQSLDTIVQSPTNNNDISVRSVLSSVMPVGSVTNIVNSSRMEQSQTNDDIMGTSCRTFKDYVAIRMQQVNKQGRSETNDNDECGNLDDIRIVQV